MRHVLGSDSGSGGACVAWMEEYLRGGEVSFGGVSPSLAGDEVGLFMGTWVLATSSVC
jgi:hypothetical protein